VLGKKSRFKKVRKDKKVKKIKQKYTKKIKKIKKITQKCPDLNHDLNQSDLNQPNPGLGICVYFGCVEVRFWVWVEEQERSHGLGLRRLSVCLLVHVRV
jgi:hypothetical protein